MGIPKEPKPAKLFMSLIFSEVEILSQGLGDLKRQFGEIDFLSKVLPFDFTNYYNKEMGSNLKRHFVTFERLIPIPSLPQIKRLTNDLELKYADLQGNRRINIDPGYLCLEHVILATTKGYTHRPYLREGIFADLTLIYRDKSYRPLEWTYPDYRQEEVIGLFNQFRRKYLEDLKREGHEGC